MDMKPENNRVCTVASEVLRIENNDITTRTSGSFDAHVLTSSSVIGQSCPAGLAPDDVMRGVRLLSSAAICHRHLKVA